MLSKLTQAKVSGQEPCETNFQRKPTNRPTDQPQLTKILQWNRNYIGQGVLALLVQSWPLGFVRSGSASFGFLEGTEFGQTGSREETARSQ